MKLMIRYSIKRMKIETLDRGRIRRVVELSLKAWAPVFDSIRETLSPGAFAESYPDGWEASQARAVEDVCLSDKMQVWTATEGEEVAGFAAIRLDHETKTGEIYMIAVDPKHQKKGHRRGSNRIRRRADEGRRNGNRDHRNRRRPRARTRPPDI